MGKAKRRHPDVEEILSRPWCYYCERDFEDLKILINHQKARHFKCERCGRRLNTAGGLSVHMTQVHKETLTAIENALPNRSNLDVEIFGMEGIPEDVANSHNQRVVTQFAQAEAERRAATGNPGPGIGSGNATKKPKFEAPSDLKKRLAEHKAKKAAELEAGISSGDATPIDGVGNQSPGYSQNPGFAGPQNYAPQQMPYGGSTNNGTYASYPQPYGQHGQMFPQNQQQFPQQSPGFGPPSMPFVPHQAFPPPQQYQPQSNPGFAPQFPAGPPQQQFQPGPPRVFGAASPPAVYHQQNQYQPPRNQTPPSRSNSLPIAAGLPQRPSFGAPPVNAFQMQQMHQGQLPGPPATSFSNHHGSPAHSESFDASKNNGMAPSQQVPNSSNSLLDMSENPSSKEAADKSASLTASIDDLISSSVAENRPSAPLSQLQPQPQSDAKVDKKSRKEKEKEKPTKMVYKDNEISPEEKMAKLPRYAYTPEGKEETALAEITPAVTGVVSGPEDGARNQG